MEGGGRFAPAAMLSCPIPPDAFAVFDRQDSGCISFGIQRGAERLFIKTALTTSARKSLERVLQLHRSVDHPAIVQPVKAGEVSDHLQVVYPWIDGTVLNHSTVDGSDRSGLDRFRRLAPADGVAAVDRVLDAHVAIVEAGFVSVDLYDGCFLYDFDARVMYLIDLDENRRGPFILEEDRLPGSTRYMAPEESVRGAVIDEGTTVFHLGRTIEQLLGPALTAEQLSVVRVATSEQPGARFGTVTELAAAWADAKPGT